MSLAHLNSNVKGFIDNIYKYDGYPISPEI